MHTQGLFWGFAPEAYPEGFIPNAPNGGYYHWSRQVYTCTCTWMKMAVCVLSALWLIGGALRSARTTVLLTYTPHPTPEKYHSMWMHSDRGRSTVWPPKLQCTLVLEDVSLYDHGFVFLSKR